MGLRAMSVGSILDYHKEINRQTLNLGWSLHPFAEKLGFFKKMNPGKRFLEKNRWQFDPIRRLYEPKEQKQGVFLSL